MTGGLIETALGLVLAAGIAWFTFLLPRALAGRPPEEATNTQDTEADRDV